jgi:hypothetical protein
MSKNFIQYFQKKETFNEITLCSFVTSFVFLVVKKSFHGKLSYRITVQTFFQDFVLPLSLYNSMKTM